MLRFNLTTTERVTMEISIRKLPLPCKLVLNDYQGFLAHAKVQGEDNLKMAQDIADRGFVRCYHLGMSTTGIELIATDLTFHGEEVGLSEDELKFFTAHSVGF